ncbi:helix-turn-helix domain-containing protein [Bacillus sp. B1-b2]|uniref:helix-turn-helix domain-containing protein n=1 Tax=Bacillus sp. B1-b2 TaxID=2653201 RepID=UPI0012627B95|nr:helix-turn-helix domain-containing protein [Bacillus sp. B1-b2]KAB7672172.1 helix-turn-helix domain-containing protein [Bacillus sp. B1-b2]
MKKIEIILHPVRFRIIQVFLDGLSKTAKSLAQELTDIPQATLYRQLDALVKAEVLLVVEENQIRGMVEKVYKLNNAAVSLTAEDLKEVSREDHLQYFLIFTTQLAKNFEDYLKNDDIDYDRDGVGYRQVALHLSDEELLQFVKDMGSVVGKYAELTPSSTRTKRLLSTILLPEKERGTENE